MYDPDDDLFESKPATPEHSSDAEEPGSDSEEATIVSGLDKDELLQMLEGLPPDAIRELSRLSSRALEEVIRKYTDMPQGAQFLSRFLEYMAMPSEASRQLPWIQAIVGHLDEESGGKITLRWRVHECERQLIAAHAVLAKITRLHEDMEERAVEVETDGDRVSYDNYVNTILFFRDYTRTRLDYFQLRYPEVAQEAGLPVDEGLLLRGKSDEAAKDVLSYEVARKILPDAVLRQLE